MKDSTKTHERTPVSGNSAHTPERLTVKAVRLDPDLPLPAYSREGDAGMDLVARVDVTLAPLERALVPTGLSIQLPLGYAAFVHPRSGLSLKEGVTVINSPGTVDAGYRGEICVAAVNANADREVTIKRGDRVAQLVVQKVCTVTLDEVTQLDPSERGEGGFGSTGTGTNGPLL